MALTGRSERAPEPYRQFEGSPDIQMPLLVSGKDVRGNVVDIPRVPASFAFVIKRRLEAPRGVIGEWRYNYFYTGDGSVTGTQGDHLIVLDAQLLRELSSKSELLNGGLVLPDGMWDELKGQENVTYLTAAEVEEANGQGYVKKNGVWAPANKSVERVWETLSRRRDLTSYIQLVSEKDFSGQNLLKIEFYQRTTKDIIPTMRSWGAFKVDFGSHALGNDPLYDYFGTGSLVGVTQEVYAANERALEERVG